MAARQAIEGETVQWQQELQSSVAWIQLDSVQWESQDPKMEELYHIRPYFVGIFSYQMAIDQLECR
jgi:hypothetical protein